MFREKNIIDFNTHLNDFPLVTIRSLLAYKYTELHRTCVKFPANIKKRFASLKVKWYLGPPRVKSCLGFKRIVVELLLHLKYGRHVYNLL